MTRVRGTVYRAGVLATAIGCGVLALAAAPAVAAPAGATAVTASQFRWASHTRWVNHFNVGAPHSPQLMAQFSGSTSGTQAGTMSPATSTTTSSAISGAVQGIDVASYQESGGINWTKVYQAGKQFAAIKVTEGTYYTNPYAATDITAAKAAGLAVVGYAFAIPNGDGGNASPIAQADYAIANAAGLHGNVPPIMLDIEYDPYASEDGTNQCYGLSKSAMAAWIGQFSAEVLTKTGQAPIIYTTTPWWTKCVGTHNANVSQDPLWVSNPNGSPGTLPAPWSTSTSTWTYWQYYTSNDTVSGINGYVDLDQANPALLTFLNPGNQQDAAGTQNVKLQLLTSQATVTYQISAGALPSGLTLSTTGLISGTAPSGTTAYTSYPVTITATDSSGTTATVTLTWYVHGTLTVSPLADRTTVDGSPVAVWAHASDSPSEPPLVFSAVNLPPGVSISSGGLISGWPDAPGTYPVTVTALDSLEAYGTAQFTWTVKTAPDSGPSGQVRLDVGGKCLNDVGNSSKNGTEADIWPCNTSSAQHWTYARDGSLRIHGKCLTAPAHPGWKVRLRPCTGAASAQWLLAYPRAVNPSAGVQPLALVNPATGWCLDDPGWNTKGTRVVAGTCNGFKSEEWTLPAGQVESQIPGKCVYDNGNRTANRTPVVLRACRNVAAERWTAEPDGTLRIHGRCLSVAHSSRTAGTKVWLWRCFGGTGQQWHLVPTGAGTTMVNPASGLCLTDPGNATRNGTRLRIEACATPAPGQIWHAQ